MKLFPQGSEIEYYLRGIESNIRMHSCPSGQGWAGKMNISFTRGYDTKDNYNYKLRIIINFVIGAYQVADGNRALQTGRIYVIRIFMIDISQWKNYDRWLVQKKTLCPTGFYTLVVVYKVLVSSGISRRVDWLQWWILLVYQHFQCPEMQYKKQSCTLFTWLLIVW